VVGLSGATARSRRRGTPTYRMSSGPEADSAAVNEDGNRSGSDLSGWAPPGGWGADLGPGISG